MSCVRPCRLEARVDLGLLAAPVSAVLLVTSRVEATANAPNDRPLSSNRNKVMPER